MLTASTHAETSEAPFFHVLPLWVLDAAHQAGIPYRYITAADVKPKTANITVTPPHADGNTVKVWRRNAFPGRSDV
jgi:hypothetical protein